MIDTRPTGEAVLLQIRSTLASLTYCAPEQREHLLYEKLLWPYLEQINRLTAQLEVTDRLLATHQRLLDAMPECPQHGQCVPYALAWIEKANARQQPQPATWLDAP